MAVNETPPDTSGRPQRGVVALVVGAALVVGGGITLVVLALTGLLEVSTPAAATATTLSAVTSTTPTVALPDGETFVYVKEVGPTWLTVDPALLLTGEDARAAAEADGVIGPGQELGSDFYIQNAAPGPMVVGVSPDIEVSVLTFDVSGGISEIDIPLADLAAAFTGEFSQVAIYGMVAGEFPVNLTVDGGKVVGVAQVYLP